MKKNETILKAIPLGLIYPTELLINEDLESMSLIHELGVTAIAPELDKWQEQYKSIAEEYNKLKGLYVIIEFPKQEFELAHMGTDYANDFVVGKELISGVYVTIPVSETYYFETNGDLKAEYYNREFINIYHGVRENPLVISPYTNETLDINEEILEQYKRETLARQDEITKYLETLEYCTMDLMDERMKEASKVAHFTRLEENIFGIGDSKNHLKYL